MIDDTIMNFLCSYVLSENNSIQRHSINNMYKFIDMLDDSMFDNKPLLIEKLHFLKKAIEVKAKSKLTDKDLIISDIKGSMDIEALLNDKKFLKELSNDDLKYLDGKVTDNLDNAAIVDNVYTLIDICKQYIESDWREKKEISVRLKNLIEDIHNTFRRNEANRESSETLFRLSTAEESLYDIHKSVTRKSYKIVTGMQGFNDMLDGGFQKKRAYCIFGLSGGGKSTTLENILYQLWKNNKGFETYLETGEVTINYYGYDYDLTEFVTPEKYDITLDATARKTSTGSVQQGGSGWNRYYIRTDTITCTVSGIQNLKDQYPEFSANSGWTMEMQVPNTNFSSYFNESETSNENSSNGINVSLSNGIMKVTGIDTSGLQSNSDTWTFTFYVSFVFALLFSNKK